MHLHIDRVEIVFVAEMLSEKAVDKHGIVDWRGGCASR
jgi:hypothetical protein